jgi:hypothetical protein
MNYFVVTSAQERINNHTYECWRAPRNFKKMEFDKENASCKMIVDANDSKESCNNMVMIQTFLEFRAVQSSCRLGVQTFVV